MSDSVPTEYLARTVAAVALAGVAIIHLVDLPDTLQETPDIGYSYFLLIAAAVAGAGLLISVAHRLVWGFASLVAGAAIVGYVFSRTTGLPTDDVDLGNWNCALGIAALGTEALIILLAAWRAMPQPAAQPDHSPGVTTEITPLVLNGVNR